MEGWEEEEGYGSLQGQNGATRSQADSIVVFYDLKNPHDQPHRLIDRGNGECWPKWVKGTVGYNVQATVPEQKVAQRDGWHRRVHGIRIPLYCNQQPNPIAGA